MPAMPVDATAAALPASLITLRRFVFAMLSSQTMPPLWTAFDCRHRRHPGGTVASREAEFFQASRHHCGSGFRSAARESASEQLGIDREKRLRAADAAQREASHGDQLATLGLGQGVGEGR